MTILVIVKENVVFSNGKTTKDLESRQSAGGFTINSGNNVVLYGNRVQTAFEGDYAYQCFNMCNIQKGGNNEACDPTNVNKKYAAFVKETSSCDIDQDGIRAKYPASSMPNSPQYSKWYIIPFLHVADRMQ